MAHDLTTRTDGFVEMAYTGDAPWHRLGNYVDHPMTAAEAIILGGQDWEVEGQPVYIKKGSHYAVVPNKQALTRVDTGEVLQVFSKDYTPVQNHEAFTFFDGVAGAGEAIYETVGTLKGGRRIWILAKLPGDLNVGDGDVLQKYILLANSHDGTMQVTMKFTPIRVVCNNTLQLSAILENDKEIKFRHTAKILNRMNDARQVLGLAEAHFKLFMRQANRLAETPFTEGQVREVASKVFKFDQDKPFAEQAPRNIAATDRVAQLFFEGDGAQLVTAKGTAWGAFNTFTAYIDHHMGVDATRRPQGGTPDATMVADQRMNISWFGVGQKMRQTAFDQILALTV